MVLPDAFQFKYYRGYSPIYMAQVISDTKVRVSWEADREHRIKANSTIYDVLAVQQLIEDGKWIITDCFDIETEIDFDIDSIL